jgi:hypothetical protein
MDMTMTGSRDSGGYYMPGRLLPRSPSDGHLLVLCI